VAMTNEDFQRLMEKLDVLTERLERVVSGESTSSSLNEAEGSPSGVARKEAVYRKALTDTVAVLEATRTSFRSRQLKDLRERIEALLEDASGG